MAILLEGLPMPDAVWLGLFHLHHQFLPLQTARAYRIIGWDACKSGGQIVVRSPEGLAPSGPWDPAFRDALRSMYGA